MTIVQLPIAEAPLLTDDELAQLTGHKMRAGQAEWLRANKWKFFTNRAGTPIVGRWYAHLMLAGITPAELTTGGWAPDFSKV